jgi:hypothetical protein
MKLKRGHLGWSLSFRNGFEVGYSWLVGWDGTPSKKVIVLMCYHPVNSINWLFSLYWVRPDKVFMWPRIVKHVTPNGYNSYGFILPYVGGLTLNTQPYIGRVL